MSVVAGCSLFDGIIMGSDCRVTFQGAGPETHRDTVQKLIALTPHTVVGFVGNDVSVSAEMLYAALESVKQRERSDGLSLCSWLPRLFRYHYRKARTSRSVAFMVGSVIPGRSNIVERASVARLIHHIGSGSTVRRSYIPQMLGDLVRIESPRIVLDGYPAGVLYTMDSPNFCPRFYRPLDYIAIGSGRDGVLKQLDGIHDMVMAGGTGLQGEAMWLGNSMTWFLHETDMSTVGGMFTMVKIGKQGAMPITRHTGEIPSGPFFELAFTNGRWIQRNLTANTEIKLVLPWELDRTQRGEHVFNDLRFRKS